MSFQTKCLLKMNFSWINLTKKLCSWSLKWMKWHRLSNRSAFDLKKNSFWAPRYWDIKVKQNKKFKTKRDWKTNWRSWNLKIWNSNRNSVVWSQLVINWMNCSGKTSYSIKDWSFYKIKVWTCRTNS